MLHEDFRSSMQAANRAGWKGYETILRHTRYGMNYREKNMTEERTTRVEEPDGSTHTTTTVVTDRPEKSGGGMGIGLILVLLIAVAAAIWAFTSMSNSEVAKDTAIENAANDVGNAAQQAGNAVQDVANDVTDGE